MDDLQARLPGALRSVRKASSESPPRKARPVALRGELTVAATSTPVSAASPISSLARLHYHKAWEEEPAAAPSPAAAAAAAARSDEAVVEPHQAGAAEESVSKLEGKLEKQELQARMLSSMLSTQTRETERLRHVNEQLVAKNGALSAENRSAARDLSRASAMMGVHRSAFRAEVCGGRPRRRGEEDGPDAPRRGGRRGGEGYVKPFRHPVVDSDNVSRPPGEQNVFRRGTTSLWQREATRFARDPDLAALMGEY